MLKENLITVGHNNADFTGKTNSDIQAAVDLVTEQGGGIVYILPGVYTMNDSLHLRSDVTIQGSGEETILWKPKTRKSDILCYLGYGHYDVSVVDPDQFELGNGICIFDEISKGFYATVGTIKKKIKNQLIISDMLNHDYDPSLNAKVVSAYPIVSGKYIKNAKIENLMINGNFEENEYLDGCRGGGIFLLQAQNITIRNVVASNYNGDGISFQQCKEILVEGCTAVDNTGHGLHPGSGSVGTTIRNCKVINNGQDGVYYCLRVSYSLCEKCEIRGNGRDGISIGIRDNDNIIRENEIIQNGRHGIYFRKYALNQSGNRTIISKNLLKSNCYIEGRGEIKVDCSVDELRIIDNHFIPLSQEKDKNVSICVNSEPVHLVIYNNRTLDEEIMELRDKIYIDNISLDPPELELQVGPEYADYSKIYHLGDE